MVHVLAGIIVRALAGTTLQLTCAHRHNVTHACRHDSTCVCMHNGTCGCMHNGTHARRHNVTRAHRHNVARSFTPTAIKVHASARFDSSLVYLNPSRDYFGLKPNNKGRELIPENLEYNILIISIKIYLESNENLECNMLSSFFYFLVLTF